MREVISGALSRLYGCLIRLAYVDPRTDPETALGSPRGAAAVIWVVALGGVQPVQIRVQMSMRQLSPKSYVIARTQVDTT
jgi:hypothetical protein